eukprot:354690-Hanusia_phi.AAC.1
MKGAERQVNEVVAAEESQNRGGGKAGGRSPRHLYHTKARHGSAARRAYRMARNTRSMRMLTGRSSSTNITLTFCGMISDILKKEGDADADEEEEEEQEEETKTTKDNKEK